VTLAGSSLGHAPRQVADIIIGTLFVFIGFACCAIAAMRRRSGVRVLVWLRGDAFGDGRLEEVVRKNQSCPPSELAEQLLSQIRIWQPDSHTQQDDITIIVVDVI